MLGPLGCAQDRQSDQDKYNQDLSEPYLSGAHEDLHRARASAGLMLEAGMACASWRRGHNLQYHTNRATSAAFERPPRKLPHQIDVID